MTLIIKGVERISVRLKDLHPNPHRHEKRYRLRPEKVAALVKSISENDWWENIEVRKARDGDGYEIAYGHHRVEALRIIANKSTGGGPDTKVGVMLRDLDEAQMLRRMAAENMETMGADPIVDMETVGAVIEAHGAGDIALEEPAPTSQHSTWRYIAGGSRSQRDHPYTSGTIAKFLGWLFQGTDRPTDRFLSAYDAWHDTYRKLWVAHEDQKAAAETGTAPIKREALVDPQDLTRLHSELGTVPRVLLDRVMEAANAAADKAEKIAERNGLSDTQVEKERGKAGRAAAAAAIDRAIDEQRKEIETQQKKKTKRKQKKARVAAKEEHRYEAEVADLIESLRDYTDPFGPDLDAMLKRKRTQQLTPAQIDRLTKALRITMIGQVAVWQGRGRAWGLLPSAAEYDVKTYITRALRAKEE